MTLYLEIMINWISIICKFLFPEYNCIWTVCLKLVCHLSELLGRKEFLYKILNPSHFTSKVLNYVILALYFFVLHSLMPLIIFPCS
jgi:hypothetical protein